PVARAAFASPTPASASRGAETQGSPVSRKSRIKCGSEPMNLMTADTGFPLPHTVLIRVCPRRIHRTGGAFQLSNAARNRSGSVFGGDPQELIRVGRQRRHFVWVE